MAELKRLRNNGIPLTEISKKLNRSFRSLEKKCRRAGIVAGTPEKKPTTLKQDRVQVASAYWKGQFSLLSHKYETLLSERAFEDKLITDIKAMAPVSYKTAPPVWRPRKSTGQPQSAVLELSDSHIGASVKPDQTLTFGEYNFPLFLARLKYLEESVVSIVKNHITTDVPELVVAMLGDMLDGALAHSNECGQLNPLFNQFYAGAHAVAQFLRNVAPHFPQVRVYEVVGNHTRYQNQKKMPTKNRYSNFDKFFYALVQALVRDVKSIQWSLSPQPFQEFEVCGHQFFAGHGENLRGGDFSMKIPAHRIGRVLSTTTQLYNKHEKKAPEYYLFGHLHRGIMLPHATGDVIINGGFVGVDEYSLTEAFTPSDPMQKLFFVHPVYGKTAVYDIGLKFAEVTEKAPYEIPAEFPVL